MTQKNCKEAGFISIKDIRFEEMELILLLVRMGILIHKYPDSQSDHFLHPYLKGTYEWSNDGEEKMEEFLRKLDL